MDPSGHRQANDAFDCPGCLSLVHKPADERMGATARVGRVPVGEWAPLRHTPPGPPFTSDDLLDFQRLLQTDDWFDQLVDLLRPRRGARVGGDRRRVIASAVASRGPPAMPLVGSGASHRATSASR